MQLSRIGGMLIFVFLDGWVLLALCMESIEHLFFNINRNRLAIIMNLRATRS